MRYEDKIENLNGSVIQHGPLNDRIYLMRLGTNDHRTLQDLIDTLDRLAMEKGYGKIFAKIPATAWKTFKSSGYCREAAVPGFFGDSIDGFFAAKYFSDRRQKTPQFEILPELLYPKTEMLPGINSRAGQKTPFCKPAPEVNVCKESEAGEMAEVYREVFESYPFPICKAGHLKGIMKNDVLFYRIRLECRIAALASADLDRENRSVEMTDFATLPAWRGRGFAGLLLKHMEKETRRLGIKTAYTIARADSVGMNSVFKNNGYLYAGLLKNNTHICGQIQSMTVWFKKL